MFADFNLLTISVLVPCDLGVGLGLCLTLLLNLDPAELLGHHLQLCVALGVVAVVTGVSSIEVGTDDGVISCGSLFCEMKLNPTRE